MQIRKCTTSTQSVNPEGRMNLIIMSAVLLVVLAMGTIGCSLTGAEKSTEDPGIPVEVMTVDISGQQMESRHTGTIVAEKVVTQGFASGGRVETLFVQAGDRVKEGDLLASLENEVFQYALDAAEAQMLAAEAQYQMALQGGRAETTAMIQAEVTMAQEKLAFVADQTQRAALLFQQGAISQQAWEEALLLETQAVLALEQARWQLSMSEQGLRPEEVEQLRQQYLTAGANRDAMAKQLEEATLTAKFAGYVASVHVEAGEMTAGGAPVVTLASVGLRAKVGLTRQEMQQLKVGDAVAVMADDDNVIPGIIVMIHPFPDPHTRTHTVEIELPSSGSPDTSATLSTDKTSLLMPGQVVTVIISGETLNGIWVPVQYVMNNGDAYVYLVEDNRARRHAVSLDAVQENQVMITGVAPGTLMITEGAGRVREGYAITW